MGVLSGVRIIEIAGIGPGPFCGMLLADLGADVIVVERPGPAEIPTAGILRRGKRSLALDLKEPGAIDTMLQLIEGSEVAVVAKLTGAVLTLMVLKHGILKLIRCLELGDVAADLYPTFAYVEDQLGVKADRLLLCGFGSTTDAIVRSALNLVDTRAPIFGVGGGLLMQGGPLRFDVGYHYKRIMANSALSSVIGTGQQLQSHQIRFGAGVRF